MNVMHRGHVSVEVRKGRWNQNACWFPDRHWQQRRSRKMMDEKISHYCWQGADLRRTLYLLSLNKHCFLLLLHVRCCSFMADLGLSEMLWQPRGRPWNLAQTFRVIESPNSSSDLIFIDNFPPCSASKWCNWWHHGAKLALATWLLLVAWQL